MQYTLNLTILYVNYISIKLKENTLLKRLKEKKREKHYFKYFYLSLKQ